MFLRYKNGAALRANWLEIIITTGLKAMACWAAQVVDASGHTKIAWLVLMTSFIWALAAFSVLCGCSTG